LLKRRKPDLATEAASTKFWICMRGSGKTLTIPMCSTTIRTDRIHRAQIAHRPFRVERPAGNWKKWWYRKRFFNRLRRRRDLLWMIL